MTKGLQAFLIAAVSLVFHPAFALHLSVDGKNLSLEQKKAVGKLIAEAEGILPEAFKARLAKNLVIEFRETSEGNHGYTQIGSDRVVLSKNLLSGIVAGPSAALKNLNSFSRHKTQYQVALGTLLHEIAHQYDLSKLVNPPFSKERAYCLGKLKEKTSASTMKNDLTEIPDQCYWYAHRANVSDDKRFTYALSWGEKEIQGDTITADAQVVRSPNPYEFKSKAEAFAVNFEFYLLDPEYQCRRLTVARYFNEHFAHNPFPQQKCQKSHQVLVSLAGAVNMTETFMAIDQRRIYQVHYLLAGPGEQTMSRWGHSMLRLVICAPERKTVGPDCLKDISHHLVVSYRAGVTDLAIDSLKGLMGDYPSQIFILPLLNVINEYTKMELRDLISYPLNLSNAELNDFTTRVLEQFWSYRGKYYFITNNCAVETLTLLKHVRPGSLGLVNASSLTPTGVRDILISQRLARSLTVDDFTQKTHFWASKAGRYRGMIAELNALPGLQIKDMATLYGLSQEQDEQLIKKVLAAGKGYSGLFTLLLAKMEKLALHKNYLVLDIIQREGAKDFLQIAQNQLQSQRHFISSYLNSGYGLPTSEEIALTAKSNQDAMTNGKEIQSLAQSLKEFEEKHFDENGRSLSAHIQFLERELKGLIQQIKIKRQSRI